ncbi:hypothetical protein ACIOHC_35835 [Streptomyces sp. NPDC088252]|uniref:hypothetical protein n=1 Tax=Streptomyces sp. NPDC088252 TaxID=3365845 RepID=UPI0038282A62
MASSNAKGPKASKGRRGSIRVTGGLKSIAAAQKYNESEILGPVQKHVIAKNNQDNSRRQDIIHPSEMAHGDWCPKATYLRIKNLRDGGTYTKESFGFQSLNIFQHGHEVHHKWQTWLSEMGILWGDWSCKECNSSWSWTSKRRCPQCGSWFVVYDEIPLSAEEELLIAGSADGGVGTSFMEFKTVGAGTLRFEEPELLKAHTHKTVDGKTLVDYEGLWRGINRPFSSHLKQGQIYLKIAEIRGLDVNRVVYIYESKFNQGTKEFVVKRRESIITQLLNSAAEIKNALDDGGPVPACPKGGCKHCEPKKAEEKSSGEESPAVRRGAQEHRTESSDSPVRRRTVRRGQAPRRTTRPVRRPD